MHCSRAPLQAKVASWLHVQRTRGKYINDEIRKSRWAGDGRRACLPAGLYLLTVPACSALRPACCPPVRPGMRGA